MYVAGVLVLGLCCFHHASGAQHSFKAFYTATTGISGFPEFIVAGVVDDVLTHIYSSDTKKVEPRTEWMKNSEGPDYWKQQSEILAGTEPTFKNNIRVVMTRFNQSEGVHTLQRMYGCQWDDESLAADGFCQDGYNGEDFITMDLENLRWIGTTPQSLITQRKWNNDKAYLESAKNYFTQECIKGLKKYLQYGSSTLERTVRPEVSLLQKDSAVVCHATGFYPEGVVITWKRDGEEMQDDVDVGEILPNEDGTFQRRAVLTVSLQQRKKGQYTCEVAHKSGTPIVVTVEDGNTLGMIIGCVVAALVVIGGVIVAVVMMKKKDYKKAEQSDTDSENSNPIARKGAECADC